MNLVFSTQTLISYFFFFFFFFFFLMEQRMVAFGESWKSKNKYNCINYHLGYYSFILIQK